MSIDTNSAKAEVWRPEHPTDYEEDDYEEWIQLLAVIIITIMMANYGLHHN